MPNLKKIIKEVLLENKHNCGCGCKGTTKCFEAPILNENLKSRVIMTENMQYHIDNKIPLIKTKLIIGSKEYLDLFLEARYLYSRGAINLYGKDKTIIIETNIGERKLIEGKIIPLDIHLLMESTNPNIYLIYCRIIVNSDKRPVGDILSDVRAVPGITVVDIKDADKNTHGVRHIIDLSLKIDPSPFEPFNKASYDEMLNGIKKIPAVLAAKYTSTPKAV